MNSRKHNLLIKRYTEYIDACNVSRYNKIMIKTWQHKGLQQFYNTGTLKGIQSKHKIRLKIILQRLDAAIKPDDLNLPGMRFHQLHGQYKGFYSVAVSGNWRVIYKFDGKDAILVDYLDYH